MMCEHGVGPCSSAFLTVVLLVLFVVMATVNHDYNYSSVGLFAYDKTLEGYILKERDDFVEDFLRETGQIMTNDKECLAEGGICTLRTSCPKDSTVNKTALCQQDNVDAVCCNSVPREVHSCHQHGGRCGQEEECRNVQSFGQLDCNEGSRCCLLIY